MIKEDCFEVFFISFSGYFIVTFSFLCVLSGSYFLKSSYLGRVISSSMLEIDEEYFDLFFGRNLLTLPYFWVERKISPSVNPFSIPGSP